MICNFCHFVLLLVPSIVLNGRRDCFVAYTFSWLLQCFRVFAPRTRGSLRGKTVLNISFNPVFKVLSAFDTDLFRRLTNTFFDDFQVREAMDLSGHKSGVYSFDFSGDTRRAATVSKDGTWRVFNIDGKNVQH